MKLKKLILSGFKSFADRTEFDFHDGISCVVGPNGCGKSNLVDAVRWVLGEQSAKSLRGSEMLDVIFNGSATRRAAGSAEVTLVFDNSRGVLSANGASGGPPDAMVSVGRRLYRSGASEYLVNKAPCRLRDIREMFMDTGIGTDAYSIIEQGRVEVFLQGSQEERRAVFDEAAGISKYKARRKDAARRLERVEQNLLRLGDVLGELEKQLRSIKYQAGKARSYQQYSQRLKDLRSLFLLAQHHGLCLQRGELKRKLDAANDSLASIHTLIDQLEASRSGTEVEALEMERTARTLQARIAALGGELTTRQERIDLLTARVKELGEQIVAGAARGEELEAKIGSCRQQSQGRQEELSQIDRRTDELAARCEQLRGEHAAGEAEITRRQEQLEDAKAGIIDLLRRTSELHNEIQAHSLRRQTLDGQRTRLTGRADEISESLEAILVERTAVAGRQAETDELIRESSTKLEANRRAVRDLADENTRAEHSLASTREQRVALTTRIDAIREMQARREGVAEGVRRVLEAHQSGRLPGIRGMLGELLQSDLEHAATVEAALAGTDQLLIAERFEDFCAAQTQLHELLGESGSVEVLALDRLGDPDDDAPGQVAPPGVIGRVIDWVRFETWVAPVARKLLGRTFVVRTLSDAAKAAPAAPPGSRVVTTAGDVLEADGRIRLGAANRTAGVITRQSELIDLQQQVVRIDPQIEQLQARRRSIQAEMQHLDELQHKIRTVVYEATTERGECRARLDRLDERLAELQRERPVVTDDLKDLAAQIAEAFRLEDQAKAGAAELEGQNAERQRQTEQLNERINAARAGQSQLTERITELQVALAQAREKRRSVEEAIESLRRQGDQMQNDLTVVRSEIDTCRSRREESQAAIDVARAESNQLHIDKHSLDREVQEVEQSREGLAAKLEEIRKQLGDRRAAAEQAGEQVSSLRMEQGEVDVRIENLIARASDEMQLNLVEQYGTYEHDEQRDWDAVEAEIRELRGKIERLGNVNLDAIVEQEQLEQRKAFLDEQLADVTSSRDQLNDLIRRINRESREMFTKTFEAIRQNFQELFRRLFGGGRADVYLLDEEDVLESGIEIVARPPGKELRSISLLSGGEKAMTAVALLFSIFRTRPSPFCLLDEVDAALDEANNERFNHLVEEFVGASQFLIITHSKRTMNMADVLYGVTMHQPGVSSRVSVRFEDVGRRLDHEPVPAGA